MSAVFVCRQRCALLSVPNNSRTNDILFNIPGTCFVPVPGIIEFHFVFSTAEESDAEPVSRASINVCGSIQNNAKQAAKYNICLPARRLINSAGK